MTGGAHADGDAARAQHAGNDTMSGASTAVDSPSARHADCEPQGSHVPIALFPSPSPSVPRRGRAFGKALLDAAVYRGTQAVSHALTKSLADMKDLRNTKLSGSNLSGFDLSQTVFTGADMRGCNLCGCNLRGAVMPAWDSGLLEGVQFDKHTLGWLPHDLDLSNARLRGAKLTGCDLRGVRFRGADLREANMHGSCLIGSDLQGARGGRAATVEVKKEHSTRGIWNDLAVHKPVVFALHAHSALSLKTVTLTNMRGPTRTSDSIDCVRHVEVFTGQTEAGPWTSVFSFVAEKTREQQTFVVAGDTPVIAGFVKVMVHDTYGGDVCIKDIRLSGEAWG